MTSPDGGETWTASSTATVEWDSTGSVGNVKIDYSTDSGSTWTNLVSSTSSDGSEAVTVPGVSSAFCRIRVQELDGSPSDMSDDDFTISSAPPTPTITVTSPNGGEAWERGTTHSITWNSSGDDSAVTIELYRGSTLYSEIDDSTSNDGSYSWAIPADGLNGSDFKIKITGNQSGANDYSNNPFTLESPGIDCCHGTCSCPSSAQHIISNPTTSWQTFSDTLPLPDMWAALRVDLSAGNTYTFKTGCGDGATASFDTVIEVYDWTTCELVACDDSACSGGLSRVQFATQGTGEYIVKVRGYDGQNGSYTLAYRREPTGSITVTSPNGGEVWERGTTHSITWNSSGDDSAVTIELYRGSTLYSEIDDSTSNDGSYSWAIPADGLNGSDFKIKITGNQSGANDYSNNPFTLDVAGIDCCQGTCSCPSSAQHIISNPTTSWQTFSDTLPLPDMWAALRVDLVAGRTYTFQTGCGNGATSDFDTVVEAYDWTTCELVAW